MGVSHSEDLHTFLQTIKEGNLHTKQEHLILEEAYGNKLVHLKAVPEYEHYIPHGEL